MREDIDDDDEVCKSEDTPDTSECRMLESHTVSIEMFIDS